MNSITKRWVRGSLFFTIAVLLVAEILFLFFMISGYQNSVRDAIDKQLESLRIQLDFYTTNSNPQTKEMQMRRLVEDFQYKSQFELMLIDNQGSVVSTSSGLLPQYTETPPDIEAILWPNAQSRGEYSGKNENGENVMAVTVRTPYSSGGIVAMRLVTSMEQVNRTIRNLVFMSLIFIFVVIFFSVVSGVYFIRSIVLPLQKVEATASRIAKGDFDTRIENKSNDEIGSLCKTINRMARELSQSERLKNEFITSVSHELRTPLTSIKGWTETVSNISDPGDPNFRRGVQIISGETDRLYDMVEELLDFSSMQHGITLHPEWLDLAAEVEEAVLLSTQRAALLDVRLLYEAPELPVPVMADKNRLRQVFINVLDNAIKYSHPNDVIELQVFCEEDEAVVTIQDEGTGISAEDLQNVKKRFYKGRGAVRGSGIGLAVVDGIMRTHKGSLEIQSEKGEGTCVTLRLPVATSSSTLAALPSNVKENKDDKEEETDNDPGK